MAGETEDTISESRSTEEVLSETDRLLSETESLTGPEADVDSVDSSEPRTDETGDADTSWREQLRPSAPSIGRSSFFSVRAYVGLVVAFGLGSVAGGLTIPTAGSLVGLFASAFAAGALASKRRYAEVAAAGTSVGAVTALLNHFVVIAGGLGDRLVLVGLTAGLLACMFGYYFGRDLRDGLTSEL